MSITAELSRPCAVDRLPAGGLAFAVEATAAERQALARRFDLASLDRLEAEGRVEVADGGLVEVAGRLRAALSQRCVVTFEPVPAQVDAEFRRLFAREDDGEHDGPSPARGPREVEIDPEAEEPEPLAGDVLDLGELVAEELAVSLDPYPRSPEAGAVLAAYAPPPDDGEGGGGSDEAAAGALAAALAPLRRH